MLLRALAVGLPPLRGIDPGQPDFVLPVFAIEQREGVTVGHRDNLTEELCRSRAAREQQRERECDEA